MLFCDAWNENAALFKKIDENSFKSTNNRALSLTLIKSPWLLGNWGWINYKTYCLLYSKPINQKCSNFMPRHNSRNLAV